MKQTTSIHTTTQTEEFEEWINFLRQLHLQGKRDFHTYVTESGKGESVYSIYSCAKEAV